MPELIGNPNAFDERGAADYSMFRQQTSYGYDPGVVVMAVASRTPKTLTARLHGGYGLRKVDVMASKRGAPPILPAAVDTDKDTLVACEINIPLPSISPGQASFDWSAHGMYMFVTTDDTNGPRIPGRDMLPAGQYPFPIPLQDRAVEVLSGEGGGPEALNEILESGNLQSNAFLWPFTIMPPAFFNSIILRDSDEEA